MESPRRPLVRAPVIVAKAGFAIWLLAGLPGAILGIDGLLSIAVLAMFVSILAAAYTCLLWPLRWLSIRPNRMHGTAPSGPTDAIRTSLQIAPKDGEIRKVGRLGGGGTHIVEDVHGTYVIVMADNGLGLGYRGSYSTVRAWAQHFVDDRPRQRLEFELLFDNITKIEIEDSDVIVWTSHPVRLRGWYSATEPSHRAQVHRLIERLGFTEQPPSSRVYRAAPKTDAQPEAA